MLNSEQLVRKQMKSGVYYKVTGMRGFRPRIGDMTYVGQKYTYSVPYTLVVQARGRHTVVDVYDSRFPAYEMGAVAWVPDKEYDTFAYISKEEVNILLMGK